MRNHPGIIVELFSIPRTKRARIVLIIGILLAIALHAFLMYLYSSNTELRSAINMGEFRPPSFLYSITTTVGFLIAPATFILILLQRLLLNENDLSYKDSPWKRRIQNLFQLKTGFLGTFSALVCATLVTILFDLYVSSNVYPSMLGWIARGLADVYVLLFGMAVFAASGVRAQ